MENELLYKHPSIFIADDDPDDVYFVQTAILELDNQIQLKHFLNGKLLIDELQRCDGNLPNFVLMDLNMPVMDGKEALKVIRQTPDFNDLPVVILSTSNYISERNLCYDYGATGYFTKPYKYSRYLDMMRKLKQEWIDHELVPVSDSRRIN